MERRQEQRPKRASTEQQEAGATQPAQSEPPPVTEAQHREPKLESTTSAAEEAAVHPEHSPSPQPSTSQGISGQRELLCVVCGSVADGFHFGVQSCSACSAFFRRSISEHKQYICLTRDCNVKKPMHLDTRKHGVVCRYCRFQKCIAVGMHPEEVQAKRGKKQRPMPPVAPTSDTTTESPSSSAVAREEESGQIGQLVRAIKVPRVALGRTGTEEGREQPVQQYPAERSLLEMVGEVRRRMAAVRRSRDGDRFQRVDLAQLRELFGRERALFAECISGSETQLRHILQECHVVPSGARLFLAWFSLESALCTLTFGGIQTNRVYLPTMGFLELQIDDLHQCHAAVFPRDAHTLARMALPIGRFFLESLCRSLQMEHFGERELNALFALLLPNPNFASDAHQPGIAEVRRRIFTELGAPLSGDPSSSTVQPGPSAEPAVERPPPPSRHHAGVALRVAGVVLTQSALLQLVAMLREHFCAMRIAH